jgi:hypothetical protein
MASPCKKKKVKDEAAVRDGYGLKATRAVALGVAQKAFYLLWNF